jgi:hypothetical protein
MEMWAPSGTKRATASSSAITLSGEVFMDALCPLVGKCARADQFIAPALNS